MKHTLVAGMLTATLSAGFVFYGTERVAGQRNVLSPEDELLATVKQHPLAKLGPWLINLYEEYQEFVRASGGQSRSAFKSRNPALNVRNGEIAVEGAANDPIALRRTLAAIGATNVRGGGNLFSARVPVDSLDRLGRDPALRSAEPALAMTQALQKPTVSQGVGSLFGLDGRDHP